MILINNHTDNFNLQLKLDISYEHENITVLVILYNYLNNKKHMRTFPAADFQKALKQYKEWEQLLF